MARQSHHHEDGNPWPELGDLLHAAVKQIRKIPLPEESRDRTLKQLQHIGYPPPPRAWLLRRVPLLVSSAIAAVLLLSLGLRYGSYPFGGYLAHPARKSPDGVPMVSGSGLVGQDDLLGGSAESVPLMVLHTGRQVGHAAPMADTSLMTLGVGQIGSNWGVWERADTLRHLTQAMPLVDRKAVEVHLHHLSGFATGEGSLSWSKDRRALPEARLLVYQGQPLQLQGVQVQVLIEGPRARTVVDHIFYNPNEEAAEGIFEYPLPDGANPSYFAFFPGNKANLEVKPILSNPPSRIPRSVKLPSPHEVMERIDPSCWGEPRIGTTVPVPSMGNPTPLPEEPKLDTRQAAAAIASFRGRIGQVLPRSHVRVLLGYEETLSIRNGKITYSHSLPEREVYDLSVTLQTDAWLAERARFLPADAELQIEEGRGTFRRSWKKVKNAGVVLFEATPRQEEIQATSGRFGDSYYLVARLRPEVAGTSTSKPFARHAVFLLDTSAGESTARFDRCVKLMQAILEGDEAIEKFNILTFSSAASWLEPRRWLVNNQAGRQQALNRLDGLILEGGTNLSQPLDQLCPLELPLEKGKPLHCFLLSEGKPDWSEADLPARIAKLEAKSPHPMRWHCYQMELGEENGELFSLLTRRGGGIYRCASDLEIPYAARAHQRSCLLIERVRFEGSIQAKDVLVANRRAAVYPHGDLVVAARFEKAGTGAVVVEGKVEEKGITQRFPVEVNDKGELAARGWAELAVPSLLALRDPRLEPLAVAYAAQFHLPSRVTGYVLTPLSRWRAPEQTRPFGGDVGQVLGVAWRSMGEQRTTMQGKEWLRKQIDQGGSAEAIKRDLRSLVDLLPLKELTLPEVKLTSHLVKRESAEAAYYLGRRLDGQTIPRVLEEAIRREKVGQRDAAASLLCGLLKEPKGQAETARLVGYHLAQTGQAGLAVQILTAQIEQNPVDPAMQRALAIALEEAGYPGRAAVHFELALGQLSPREGWHAAVKEEYRFLLRRALQEANLSARLQGRFQARLEELREKVEPQLFQISTTWNTEASQVQVKVTGPDGKVTVIPEPDKELAGMKCGPRRFFLAAAQEGEYKVELQLTRSKPEIKPETLITVQAIWQLESDKEKVQTERVLLRQTGDKVALRFKP